MEKTMLKITHAFREKINNLKIKGVIFAFSYEHENNALIDIRCDMCKLNEPKFFEEIISLFSIYTCGKYFLIRIDDYMGLMTFKVFKSQ
jgi:hypothetical protein